MRALGDRLGPLLVRPADDRKRDDGFLRALLDGIDDDLWPAFDLRDPSWDGVEELLEGRDAVRVNQLDAPAPFRYLRLREPPYDDAALSAWADRLRPLLDDGLAVHCYFRHEDEPTAPAYARRLLELSRPASGAARRRSDSDRATPKRQRGHAKHTRRRPALASAWPRSTPREPAGPRGRASGRGPVSAVVASGRPPRPARRGTSARSGCRRR